MHWVTAWQGWHRSKDVLINQVMDLTILGLLDSKEVEVFTQSHVTARIGTVINSALEGIHIPPIDLCSFELIWSYKSSLQSHRESRIQSGHLEQRQKADRSHTNHLQKHWSDR